jgi:hypothetical protein
MLPRAAALSGVDVCEHPDRGVDVGLTGQLDEPVAVGGAAGLQHRRALIGVLQCERHSGPRHHRACDAVRHTSWQFDLEDVGAQVTEQPAHRIAVSAADVPYPQRRQGSIRLCAQFRRRA